MNKDEMFFIFKLEFEYLFPEYIFTEDSFNRLYSMATIDLLVFKNKEMSFYEFLWRKTFCWLYLSLMSIINL